MSLEKYGSLALYDEYVKIIFIIDHEELQFDKNIGWTLIVIPYEPNGSMSDRDIFFIHDDLLVGIKWTHKEMNYWYYFRFGTFELPV